jgi:8-amino-7-oxononanoate synthase
MSDVKNKVTLNLPPVSRKVEMGLKEQLNKRSESGLLRSLKIVEGLVDFSSNDYLGLASNTDFNKTIEEEFHELKKAKTGSTGSRLLSGNSVYAEELEILIASFHHCEAALLFNSGYDANVGLLSCLAQRGDTYISDELVHASIIDGMRLSYAERLRFGHNDMNELEEKLKIAKGRKYIVVESVYSMDGDMAPLKEIVLLAEKYNASVIVDEAHATGVIGKSGEGLVQHLKLEDKVFARVHTFGKALGTHGGVVAGSNELKQYLINFARSFIYTTALPLHSLAAIKTAYWFLPDMKAEREKLQENVAYYHSLLKEDITYHTPIKNVIIAGNEKVKQLSAHLAENGFDVRPILSPTVPTEKERLRICLHSFNTKEEIKKLILLIEKFKASRKSSPLERT